MRLVLLIALVAGGGLALTLLLAVTLPAGLIGPPRFVAVVPVEGLIASGPAGVPGLASSDEINRALREADRDPSVGAILLRVNSPGGTPAAVQEIVREMERVTKPVVVSMGDIAASGAYYVASRAQRVYASSDTLTGSIGAIWVLANASGKHAEEGVNFTVIKSGSFKDLGGDYRGPTEAEKAYLQQMVNELLDRFVDAVAEGRNLSRSEVLALADGRLYSGVAARGFRLVDELGNFYDALDGAARLAGLPLPAEPKRIQPGESSSAPFRTGVRTFAEAHANQPLLVPPLTLA